MPIRTNRGRVAVYRRLWGWPIRSAKHLTGTVIFLVVLVVLIGILLPKVLGGSGGAATPNAGPTEGSGAIFTNSTGQSASQPVSTRLTAPLATPTPAPPDPEALAVAKSWVAAWVNHPEGTTNDTWREGLKPYTTEEFLPQLSTVEVTNISANQVTGEPTVVTSYTSSVVVQIPTNGPMLSITVVRTESGWRVTQYDQAG